MLALVYGGGGSGKSEFAEDMLRIRSKADAPLLYVATMRPDGDEARERIARHRANRARKGFVTVECHAGLEAIAVPDGSRVLLECLGNLAANEMFAPGGAGDGTAEAIERGIDRLSRKAERVVVVSSDVGSDGAVYAAETEAYRRVLAGLNQWVAGRSGTVVETVCGIPLRHKWDGAWEQ